MNRLSLRRGEAGALLGLFWLLLGTPQARSWLETTMQLHMLLQIPLLVAIGVAAGRLLPAQRQARIVAGIGGAIPCVLLAIFASSYWMLPRALDAAIGNSLAEIAKFLSLPLLVGLPLALAWHRAAPLWRQFIGTNFISMLGVLGWLYIASPVRVCNNYLVDEQNSTGWLMVKLAVLLFAWWLATLFCGGHRPAAAPETTKRYRRDARVRLA